MSAIPVHLGFYEVSLYASRELADPNRTGEHEHSLRSLKWTGLAESREAARKKAMACLDLALAAIRAIKGKDLRPLRLAADSVVEKADDGNSYSSIQFGEVMCERLKAARKTGPSRRFSQAELLNALQAALLSMLGAPEFKARPGEYHLRLCPLDPDGEGPFGREVETDFIHVARNGLSSAAEMPAPPHVEALRAIAAVCRLHDPRNEGERPTQASVIMPESATLLASFVRELRASRSENGRTAAAFLRGFGFESEALAFEEAGQ